MRATVGDIDLLRLPRFQSGESLSHPSARVLAG
jgi:hypothetical protein